jgi:8-oxo-dGTP pyrophosphatase MutT (NUDIX family)
MRFDHDPNPPMRVTATRRVGGSHLGLRLDECAWPDGTTAEFNVVEAPCSTLIVPVFHDGSTVLVRQWRHAWDRTSWEVTAGTMEEGEEPIDCARRELVEEAGLTARHWTPLGTVRPSAWVTNVQHLFLAREPVQVERRPEVYEQDLAVRRLPLAEAVAAALNGEIEAAGSIVALCRAARELGVDPAA